MEKYAKEYVLNLLKLDAVEIKAINLGFNLSDTNKIKLELNTFAQDYIKKNWKVK